MAYFDHAATTAVLPAALEAMLPWLTTFHGNPSGVHREARRARQALEEAREEVAGELGARPHEVVFTSGGTEALNLAVFGVDVEFISLSAIEHEAVRRSAVARFHQRGTALHEVPVGESGVVDAAGFAGCRGLVALMAVNNEVGTIQPVRSLREHAPEAVVLVDAVCAVPWTDVRSDCADADLVAVSAHKFGGPKGIGALVVRGRRAITPIIHGGGQEHERRSGTQNVAGAVGMAAALRLTNEARVEGLRAVSMQRDRLADALLAAIPEAVETGDRARKAAGNVHLCIDGVESEALLMLLDRAGLSASAGSACASGALHASHVLLAMGLSKARALGSLRLTLAPPATASRDLAALAADVDEAINAVPAAVRQLRGCAGPVKTGGPR